MLLTGTAREQLNRYVPPPAAGESVDRTFRAFKAHSWWNTPLPVDAPTDPANVQILRYLRTGPGSAPGCLMLAGLSDEQWGSPIFWARPTDPVYRLQSSHRLPLETTTLRIPVEARPAADNDGTMTIYDLEEGYVTTLTDAAYDPDGDTWSASAATVTYVRSNGLDRRTGRADAHNTGTHRGNNGAVMVVSWDQVASGAVRHVLKIASGPDVADRYIFPMVGSDGHYRGKDPAVPPEGIRLRLRPNLRLASLDLSPQALVIARAIQRYGVYIGDSGSRTTLKVENTEAEGRGQLWSLDRDALCGLPFSPRYWEVVKESFDPTVSGR